MNRETENIFYDMRIIIDNKVLTEPRTWKVSKVNRISPNGVSMITLAQTFFDEHKDYIELDNNGNVIGMWADYFTQAEVSEYEENKSNIRIEITCPGKDEIKIGGSYKTFTAKFYDGETEISPENGQWQCYIDETVTTDVDMKIDNNQCKVKFMGDITNIGKKLNVKFISDSLIESSHMVDIRRL